MHIRKVDGKNPRIAATIRALHEEIFADEAPAVDPAKGHWWLVRDGARVVGFAGMLKATEARNTGYLYRVGVCPLARGHGLQRRFIRVREAWARREGWTKMITDTNENPESDRNLRLAGYSLYVPVVKYSTLKTAVYWRKSLAR